MNCIDMWMWMQYNVHDVKIYLRLNQNGSGDAAIPS